MSGRRVIIVLCLALALSIAAVPANAEEVSGTVTLNWLETYVIEMNPEIADDMRGHWDVRVTDGSPVNVYFTSWTSYSEYTNSTGGELKYSELHSMLNTTSFSKTVGLSNFEPEYLIIECAGFSATDSSTVEYEVVWEDEGEDWYEWCIPWFGVGAVVVAVTIFAWWRLRGGRSADGAPLDVTPPPGTG